MKESHKKETTVLRVKDLEKYYGNRSALTKALNKITFQIKKGEFVAIMGASGSGKTTLLNIIATIDRATAGEVFVDGENITKIRGQKLSDFRRDKLGFIFQDYNLLDSLTARENIALALSIRKINHYEIEDRVERIASELNITEILDKFPYQMSGGQKQRVAAARAIVTEPKLILADEPTGALDSKSASLLLSQLVELNQRYDATIMMVTHDAFAASYAERVIFLQDGKIFNEIRRDKEDRQKFFDAIIDVVSLLGGQNNVLKNRY